MKTLSEPMYACNSNQAVVSDPVITVKYTSITEYRQRKNQYGVYAWW
jgi:hypothetical protein